MDFELTRRELVGGTVLLALGATVGTGRTEPT